MKPTLSLRIGQQLAMTPQLQQAIRLLQMSTLDLQQEIQQAVESNPMLELEEDSRDASEEQLEAAGLAGLESFATPSDSSASEDPRALDDSRDQSLPEELPIDTQWGDIFPDETSAGGSSDEDWDLDSRNASAVGLHDHLRWQLNVCHLSDRDRAIGEAIIDALSDDGLLSCSVEELCESLNRMGGGQIEDLSAAEDPLDALSEIDAVETDEVIAVLKRIQQLEPTGVGARDLSECLLLQLRQLPPDTPWIDTAATLLTHHLGLLESRDIATLMRRLQVNADELSAVMRLIRTLNPRPGGTLPGEKAEYVVPDVFVFRRNNRWVVELNADTTPKLRVNERYAGLIRRSDTSSDNVYLRDHLQEARWFLKSLQSRNETMLKVATKIVERQRGFLDHGAEAMKPLVLADIADAVEMHESTISRVTNRKYMYTPRGIFELKYFFSSHVSNNDGGEVSSTAIRALIRRLTAEENPRKPLSDQKLVELLAAQNIVVARRTVAKYRESLAIPSSSERKRVL
ncbi:MAG: RNA polymerase factor sigma-54 [Pseudomonadales bacterium]